MAKERTSAGSLFSNLNMVKPAAEEESLTIPTPAPVKVSPVIEASPAIEEPVSTKMSMPVVIPSFEKKDSKPVNEKRGRPKKCAGECKMVSFKISAEMYKYMTVASFSYGNNVTKYLESLISKDIERNKDSYDALLRIANNSY